MRFIELNLPTGTSVGPKSVNGTVRLTGPAPTGGATVTLSSNSANVTTPASVTIAAGSTQATFAMTIGAVSSTETVTITARALGLNTTGQFRIGPAGLSGFGTVTNPIVGGLSGIAVITANTAIPSGGVTIELQSSNPAVLQVPESIFFDSGHGTSITPTFTTSNVAIATNVTLTASLNGSQIQKTIQVMPVDLQSIAVSGELLYGRTYSGTVKLTGPAPANGVVIPLSMAANTAISIPQSVSIPAGETQISFQVTTLDYRQSISSIAVTANLGATSKSISVRVIPVDVLSVTFSSSRMLYEQDYQATIILTTAAPSGGLQVSLDSSSPEVLAVPVSVDLPEGATQVTFPITTLAYRAEVTVVQVSAQLGSVTKAVSKSIIPDGPGDNGSYSDQCHPADMKPSESN